MSDINININLPDGRISSITLSQLVNIISQQISLQQEAPSPSLEAGDNIQLSTNTTTGGTIISTVDVPNFDGIDLNNTFVFPNQNGQLTETIGVIPKGILLTQSDIVGVTPVQVTPTPTGIEIAVTGQDVQLTGGVVITDNGPSDPANLTVVSQFGGGTITSNDVSVVNSAGTPTVSIDGETGTILSAVIGVAGPLISGSVNTTSIVTSDLSADEIVSTLGIIGNLTAPTLTSTNITTTSITSTSSNVDTLIAGSVNTTDVIASNVTSTNTTTSNVTAGTITSSSIDAPVITTSLLDVVGSGGQPVLSLDGSTGDITFSIQGTDTLLSQGPGGFLSQTVGGVTYPIPTTTAGAITGTAPIIVTPMGTGADISISPDPVFNTVGVGGITLSSVGENLFIDDGTGPVEVVTVGDLPVVAGNNIVLTSDPITQDVIISTTPDPIFNSVNTSSIILAETILTSDASGNILKTSGGTEYLLSQSTLTGGNNIVVTPIGEGDTVSTVPDPTFANVTIGTTLLDTDGGGLLRETIGGIPYVLLREGDAVTSVLGVGNIITAPLPGGVVSVNTISAPTFSSVNLGGTVVTSDGAGNIIVDDGGVPSTLLSQTNFSANNGLEVTITGTDTSIGISPNPLLRGAVSVTDFGTIPASLTATNSGATGTIISNNFVQVDGIGNPQVSIGGGVVTSAVSVIGGSAISARPSGFLQETVAGIPLTILTNGNLTGVGNITTTSVGDVVEIDTIDNPTFDTVFSQSLNVRNTTILAGVNGQLEQRFGGNTYPIPLTSGISTAIPGTNIVIDTPTVDSIQISTVPDPTFSTSVTTPLVVVSTLTPSAITSDTNGNLVRTSGVNQGIILTSDNLVGSGFVTVTPTPTGASVGTTSTPSFTTISASGDANIGGTTTTSDLVVTGSSTLNTVTTSSDTSIGGDLTVSGNTELANLVAVGDVFVDGNLEISGGLSIPTLAATNVVAGELTSGNITSVSDIVANGTVSVGGTVLSAGTGGNLQETIVVGGTPVTGTFLTSLNTTSANGNLIISQEGSGNIRFTISPVPGFTSIGTTSVQFPNNVLAVGQSGYLEETPSGGPTGIILTSTNLTSANANLGISTNTITGITTLTPSATPTYTTVTATTSTTTTANIGSSVVTSDGSLIDNATRVTNNHNILPLAAGLNSFGISPFKFVIMEFDIAYTPTPRTFTITPRSGPLLFSPTVLTASNPTIVTDRYLFAVGDPLPFTSGFVYILTPMSNNNNNIVPVLAYNNSTGQQNIETFGWNTSSTGGTYTPMQPVNLGILAAPFTYSLQAIAMGI